jgi:hypothetical protein
MRIFAVFLDRPDTASVVWPRFVFQAATENCSRPLCILFGDPMRVKPHPPRRRFHSRRQEIRRLQTRLRRAIGQIPFLPRAATPWCPAEVKEAATEGEWAAPDPLPPAFASYLPPRSSSGNVNPPTPRAFAAPTATSGRAASRLTHSSGANRGSTGICSGRAPAARLRAPPIRCRAAVASARRRAQRVAPGAVVRPGRLRGG